MYAPTVLQPTPDPAFVRELKLIDPALRVRWGQERYFVENWVIERKISPERYYAMYRMFFESNQPRFINRPIYDDDKPLYDEQGNRKGSEVIGYDRYDLAPEWEWVMFVEESDHSYRALDSRTILALKRTYAYERFHSFSRARFEAQREADEKETSRKSRHSDIIMESVDEAYGSTGFRKSIVVDPGA